MARMKLVSITVASAIAGLMLLACSDNPTKTHSATGRTTDFVGCKTDLSAVSVDGTPTGQACIEYEYDGESVLLLEHVNAIFNCCPDSVGGEVSIDGQNITIDEIEWLTMPCDCICPFDVEYKIVNLAPGEYTIKVNEIYLRDGAELLEFTVDLAASPSGEFCVNREIPIVDAGSGR